MNKLEQGYYYIFYKFYKMSEAAPSKWWSEWKAAIATLLLKYENNILFFHQKISKIFDSFTLEYMEKKISPEEYNNIMNSLNLDSVNSKKEELSKLGVNFDLKSKK